jgi:hypothetical protein
VAPRDRIPSPVKDRVLLVPTLFWRLCDQDGKRE